MYGLSILEYHVKNAWDASAEGSGGDAKKNVSAGGFGVQKTAEGLLILTPKQKISLQQSLLNMVVMGLNDALDEEVYLKEKICVVLAEIAKRSWPLDWPFLMRDLVGASPQAEASRNAAGAAAATLPPGFDCIASIGISQLEIVSSFFRVIAEDIGSPISDVPNSRKKMMINGMHLLADDYLFPFFYHQLDHHYAIYQQAKQGYVDEQLIEMLPGGKAGPSSRRGDFLTSVGQADLLTSPQHIALHQSILAIHSILQALVAFAEWMKLELFVSSGKTKSTVKGHNNKAMAAASEGLNLAQVLVLFLAEAPFRVRAAELLLVMVSRPRPERDAMIFLFEHMPLMTAAMDTVPPEVVMAEVEARGGASSSAPALSFSRRLAQTLCLLGQIYFDFLNINRPPPNLDIFMSLMLNIASHPSLQLSALAAAFWKRFLSQSVFQQQAYFVSTCETLLGNMQWAFVKWHFWTEGTDPTSGLAVCPPLLHAFRMVDFEDDEETYLQFQAEHRNLLTRSIIAPIAQIVPATAMAFIRFQWSECTKIFSSLGDFSSGTIDPKQVIEPDLLSALSSLFESVCHLMSVVNESISPSSMGVPAPSSMTPEIQSLFLRGKTPGKVKTATASGKKKSNNNKAGKEGDGGGGGALQDDAEAHQLIFSSSSDILTSLINFDSYVDEITSVQIDACKSFLSFFYASPDALQVLLSRLLSLVTYSGLNPNIQAAVQQAQAAFEAGDHATCHGIMTEVLSGPKSAAAASSASSSPSLPRSTMSLRKKACTALISIGKAIPSALVGQMSSIMEMLGDRMTRGLVSSAEIILLMDWVSSLSNAMEPEQQAEFLKSLIGQQVEQWQGEEVSNATASSRALLAFSGALPRHTNRQRKALNATAGLSPYDPSLYADLPPSLIPASPIQAQAQRSQLSTLLDSLCAVWRRASNASSRKSSSSSSSATTTTKSAFGSSSSNGKISPLEAYYETDSNSLSSLDLALLPNLLRLIACIHQMWSGEVKEQFEDSCKGAYQLNEHLISTWLRTTTSKASSSHDGGDHHDGGITGMAGDWMMGGDDGGFGDGNGGASDETASEQSVWNRFFTSTRNQAYTLLGSIIQHQSPFWMDSPDLLNSFAGAVLVNLDEMHPYDLSLLLKRVILPAIQTCPPHAYGHLQSILEVILPRAGELVSQLYKSKAEKERATAQAVASAAQATRANLPAQLNYNSFSTQSSFPEMGAEEEIVLDRSVVELLTTVALVVQTCVLRTKGNGYIPGDDTNDHSGGGGGGGFGSNGFSSFASPSSSATATSSKSSYTYPLSNFFVHLLRTGNGSTHWLLACVNSIFAWAESHSTRRMCNVLTTIISGMQEAAEERLFVIGPLAASNGNANQGKRGGGGMAGVSMATTQVNVSAEAEARLAAALEANPFLPPDDPSTAPYLVAHSFKAILYALHQQSENAGMMVTLAREMYSLDPSSANATLLEIPNITHAVLNKFYNDLTHQSTQKGKSGVMRELLEKVAGWDLTPAAHSATHTTRILDVPAPLFALHVAKRQQAAKEKQALDDQAQLGLNSLFAN